MNVRANFEISCAILAAWILGTSATIASAQYAGPAVTSPPRGAGAKVDYGDVRIMPGDVVMVSTYGVPELTNLGLKIGPNGEVVLPYLGSVKLAGLTASEAAIFLSTALKNGGLLVDPQISVQLTDSPTRIITVIGEVQRPMPIPAFGQLRLLDVISACGGFTPLASHRITVQRPSNPDPIIVEIGVNAKATDVSDIPLMAGDTVIVPKVGSVFVVGEVKSSLAFPLSSNTPVTVMRAITMAGGVKFSAALSKARVIRTTPDNQRVEIMLDLKKLMNGEQQDIALASDDVLFVPANSFKAALAGGGASVLSALVITGTQTYSVIR
jgi:polysaccharide export outer membrane protein